MDKQLSRGRKESEIDWDSVLSWALLRHMAPSLAFLVANAVCAETLAIFYSYFVGNMIEYL